MRLCIQRGGGCWTEAHRTRLRVRTLAVWALPTSQHGCRDCACDARSPRGSQRGGAEGQPALRREAEDIHRSCLCCLAPVLVWPPHLACSLLHPQGWGKPGGKSLHIGMVSRWTAAGRVEGTAPGLSPASLLVFCARAGARSDTGRIWARKAYRRAQEGPQEDPHEGRWLKEQTSEGTQRPPVALTVASGGTAPCLRPLGTLLGLSARHGSACAHVRNTGGARILSPRVLAHSWTMARGSWLAPRFNGRPWSSCGRTCSPVALSRDSSRGWAVSASLTAAGRRSQLPSRFPSVQREFWGVLLLLFCVERGKNPQTRKRKLN